ncbi:MULTISPECIES: hypothetical protein [unclassified Actinotignum]|uniref:hypothetical protein n=1 Tax=unclassified Actinotignum TaxID=2632702 RepID=UPI002A82BFD5|nr:hypothetical protein [Actinotignum sp. SLA_B059]MDY5127451.1 hypothetical protein [Actinotignum sp. SLA_B059]
MKYRPNWVMIALYLAAAALGALLLGAHDLPLKLGALIGYGFCAMEIGARIARIYTKGTRNE